ncbi:MAG: HNH endonuclease [Pseudomonadales bacterium]|nr:HNH endonuclease [Pseudomonadales bacterium]
MRDKDIKILWGRAGNRCSICKLELTPDGEKETLGEMAHIIAKSQYGPRGDSTLNKALLDEYKNLILVCPTHHTEIDKNYQDWSIDKLIQAKKSHEAWVSEQLAEGNISVSSIDNKEFLDSRTEVWTQMCRDHVGVIVSITPLRVSNKILDSLNEISLETLRLATLPADRVYQRVNPHHLRPTEFGAVIERFPGLPNRMGHSIHIFDTGHCEYLYELGLGCDRVTEVSKSKGAHLKGADRVIRYTDIAEAIDCASEWLIKVWSELLPVEYANVRCTVVNTLSTTLYSYEESYTGGVFGHPLSSDRLIYDEVLARGLEASVLKFDILKWLSRCFGLVLRSVYDRNNDYSRPVPFV